MIDDPINRGNPERLSLKRICVNEKFNARQKYRDVELLARSIEASGLEQPLVVYVLPGDEAIYLQSGFRRKRALDMIDPSGELEVLCIVKSYPTHDEAMFSALAVDTTGDPLRDYDLAVRLDYLNKKHPKRDLPRITGIEKGRMYRLLGCLRELDPKIVEAWSKAPSPEHEIPIRRLNAWRKESPADQRRLFAAYQNGDEEILGHDGQPARGRRGGRLDGKGDRPTVPQLRDELARVHLRMEDGGGAVETARLEGIAKGLRFAMGELTRVF